LKVRSHIINRFKWHVASGRKVQKVVQGKDENTFEVMFDGKVSLMVNAKEADAISLLLSRKAAP
jgi:hypothetical protein